MRTHVLVVMLLALAASGCARSTLSQHYLLIPRPAEAAPRGGNGPTLGIGPVTLPGYTDRDNIVTLGGTHRLNVDEDHLWAEPLEQNVTHVLAENLSVLTGADRVCIHPWSPGDADYRITVDVTRMIGRFGGDAWVDARWTIEREAEDGSVALVSRRTTLTGPAGGDWDALAARFSDMLLALSREIAGAVPR
jgi:uncharacterized lipoprotein YmbA